MHNGGRGEGRIRKRKEEVEAVGGKGGKRYGNGVGKRKKRRMKHTEEVGDNK